MHRSTRFVGLENGHLGPRVEEALPCCEGSVERPGRGGGSVRRDCCCWKTRRAISVEAHPPSHLLAGVVACSFRFAPPAFGGGAYPLSEIRHRRTKRTRWVTALAVAASSSWEEALPAHGAAVDKGDHPGQS